MKKLLSYLVKGITGSDDFVIEETGDDDRVTFNVKADKDIVGFIIGKNGKTIRTIRNILRVKAALEKKGVYVTVTEKT